MNPLSGIQAAAFEPPRLSSDRHPAYQRIYLPCHDPAATQIQRPGPALKGGSMAGPMMTTAWLRTNAWSRSCGGHPGPTAMAVGDHWGALGAAASSQRHCEHARGREGWFQEAIWGDQGVAGL